MLILTAVVVCSAIVAIFATEFTNIYKKLIKLPGVKLITPFFIASYIVISYKSWILWYLWQLRIILNNATFIYSSTHFYQKIIAIGIIASFTLIPVIIIELLMKKRSYADFEYSYVLMSILWIIIAMFIVIIQVT